MTKIKSYVEEARLFAEADKSNPFAYSTAISHLRNGLVGVFLDDNNNIKEAYYGATVFETEGIPLNPVLKGAETHTRKLYGNLIRV